MISVLLNGFQATTEPGPIMKIAIRMQRRPRAGTCSRPPLLLAGLLLVAVNMRPALAVISPVLGQIRIGLHISGATAALLTALPVACFGVVAPVGPALARRLGLERALTAALVLLLVGMLLRLGPDLATLLAGTVVLGGGIAVANVLLPALVKRDFPNRVGPVTGMYSTAINLAAATAAGTVVPLAAAVGHGWRGGLAAWVIPVIPALAVLVTLARPAPAAPSTTGNRLTMRGLARHKRARQVIAFTAAQSVIYYSVLSWLPSIYISHGMSAAAAGLLLSATTLVSAPIALILPTLAARRTDQRGYVVVIACCAGAGLLGVLAAPTSAPYLWAVLLGIGIGGAFPLALTLFVLRTRDATETARLSTGAQTVAYLIAAAGPVALGVLHDATGSWAPGIGLLLTCAVAELLAGLGAGRPGHIITDSPNSGTAPGETPAAPAVATSMQSAPTTPRLRADPSTPAPATPRQPPPISSRESII